MNVYCFKNFRNYSVSAYISVANIIYYADN